MAWSDHHEGACGWATRSALRRFRLAALLAAVALCGCGLSENTASTLMVDPGHYEGYHCNELVAQWQKLVAREKDLRNLMERAQESGNAVIGTITYRADYETVLGEQRVLQRTAAEKKCTLVPAYQSDQTIR
jgi:hypothetical protein